MATFPTFLNGIVTQLPTEESDIYPVTQSYLPCGVTYTTQWNGGNRQMRFNVHFDTMLLSERNQLETFWHNMGGQLGSFTFTDDKGIDHTNSRFDQPNIDFRYEQVGAYGLDVKILALN